MPQLANTALSTAAAELTHMQICTPPKAPTRPRTQTHTHRDIALIWVVTCPLDNFHHVGGEVAHAVISSAIVMNAAFPPPVRMLFQNLPTNSYVQIKIPNDTKINFPSIKSLLHHQP